MEKNIMLILFITIILTFIISKIAPKSKKDIIKIYEEINNNDNFKRETINEISLPLIEDDKKYIELQTKEWIFQREKEGYCYGLLEKDKVVMSKWIKKYNINAPKIYLNEYYDNFNFEKLRNIVVSNPYKRFVIKISHLQSNYGILIVEPFIDKKDIKYLEEIYKKCLIKFKTCFVCNHDNSDAPTEKEINKRIKDSYYKLYETIQPGIVIQEFFYSVKENLKTQPIEFKILVFGDKIINGAKSEGGEGKNYYPYERTKPVYDMAKKVSNLLGSSLIRVDIFVKKEDNPFVPYLNEISLSPNGGFNKNNLDKEKINKLKEEIKNYKPIKMEIDDLIKTSPKRTLPIEKYLSDNDLLTFYNEKYRFGFFK
jgi:hypothetical protein